MPRQAANITPTNIIPTNNIHTGYTQILDSGSLGAPKQTNIISVWAIDG